MDELTEILQCITANMKKIPHKKIHKIEKNVPGVELHARMEDYDSTPVLCDIMDTLHYSK